jgi:hypothetical protein
MSGPARISLRRSASIEGDPLSGDPELHIGDVHIDPSNFPLNDPEPENSEGARPAVIAPSARRRGDRASVQPTSIRSLCAFLALRKNVCYFSQLDDARRFSANRKSGRVDA